MAEIIKFNAPAPLCEVPALVGKDGIKFNNCSDGYYMAFVPSVSADEFAAYCALLESDGYVKTYENTIKDNVFFNYVNSDNGVTVYTYRVGHSSEVRVIAGTNVPAFPEKKNGPKVCEPLIIQLNSSHDILQLPEGMSYVVRVEDGSFIVIDGGYRRGCFAKMIYDALVENAPDPDNIVISAWYFTHDHGDHAGAFIDFGEMYWDQPITIERLIYNFVDDPEYCENFQQGFNVRTVQERDRFWPKATLHCKLNAGQKYYFGDTCLDILFGIQDFMPRDIPNEADATPKNPKKGDGNNLSVVGKFTFGNGKTFFVMGDTTSICCDEMCARYGDFLKSDYVQMSHHGLSKPTPRAHNATIEIYDMIDADVAFMPCSIERSQVRLEYEVNAHLAAKVKKLYVAGAGTQIVYP